jgi:hypothetical protein
MEPPPLWRDWDLGLELPDDVSEADWLHAALRPWGPSVDGPVQIASFVPDSYEAFARILHPARDGCLPAAQLAALGDALAPFTAMPGRCAFCFWIGYGFWGGRVGYSLGGDVTAEQRAAILREAVARAEAEEAQLAPIPLVRLPHREHYVFTGALDRTARPFRFDVWEQSPNMWWPADRTWFVATEIDGYSTYVGGSAACIDAVLTCPGIEAIAVTPETPMDPGPYG